MALIDKTVAIIGTGTIGSTLAANFAVGGQDYLLADRDQDKTGKVASDVSGHAEVVGVDEAVNRADVIVVAVWLDDFKQFIARYGDRLAGKVIVDTSNPVGPDGAGGFEPVGVGGLDQAIRIEMFGDLHEYGALGRVVAKSEALQAI